MLDVTTFLGCRRVLWHNYMCVKVNHGLGVPRFYHNWIMRLLTHWGRVTHICVTNLSHHTLGRDLMRERTRSRIQDGGPEKRSANTVPFLPFNTDFSTRNWYPGKFMFRVNTRDIKFNRIWPLLLLNSVWNLTQDARTNLIWCANVHCIKTTDARTHIKMR